MREILFRGKRIDNGEWIFGSLIHRGDYCCILPPDGVLHDSEEPYMDSDLGTFDGKAIPVDPETVGQYTGLTDKNGRRIFEGDLLVLATSRTHEVKFADGSFYMNGTGISIHHAGRFTIVGNRLDNPELLEEKE